MKKKIVSALCALAMVATTFGVASPSIFATVNETQTVTDADLDENNSFTAQTTVTINGGTSTFTVTIPKTMTGADKSGVLDYEVTVEGDIAGTDVISVVPEKSVTLKQSGKADVVATIAQEKETFSGSELFAATNNTMKTNGSVTYAGLSAGTWKGTFNFNINLESAKETVVSRAAGVYINNLFYSVEGTNSLGEIYEIIAENLQPDIENIIDIVIPDNITYTDKRDTWQGALNMDSNGKTYTINNVTLPDTITEIGYSTIFSNSITYKGIMYMPEDVDELNAVLAENGVSCNFCATYDNLKIITN